MSKMRYLWSTDWLPRGRPSVSADHDSVAAETAMVWSASRVRTVAAARRLARFRPRTSSSITCSVETWGTPSRLAATAPTRSACLRWVCTTCGHASEIRETASAAPLASHRLVRLVPRTSTPRDRRRSALTAPSRGVSDTTVRAMLADSAAPASSTRTSSAPPRSSPWMTWQARIAAFPVMTPAWSAASREAVRRRPGRRAPG